MCRFQFPKFYSEPALYTPSWKTSEEMSMSYLACYPVELLDRGSRNLTLTF
jgi:hypothetical protein